MQAGDYLDGLVTPRHLPHSHVYTVARKISKIETILSCAHSRQITYSLGFSDWLKSSGLVLRSQVPTTVDIHTLSRDKSEFKPILAMYIGGAADSRLPWISCQHHQSIQRGDWKRICRSPRDVQAERHVGVALVDRRWGARCSKWRESTLKIFACASLVPGVN